jgi:tRNA modification GTPase
MKDRKPIVAQSTAQGTGAIAIIRISGEKAFSVFLNTVVQKERFDSMPPRRISLYTLLDKEKNQILDEVTAIKYKSPRSFTGENMVEIFCHGGTVVIRDIIDSLIRNGAQPAGRGEFTRRALENGKIDLLKAEAIKGIIEGTNEPEVICAQKMYDGKINALIAVKEKMLAIQSDLEAEIEFGEDGYIGDRGKNNLSSLLKEFEKEIQLRKNITNITGGIRIVITGPTNAGKSTLFNRLLGYNRAIVHHDPGTTRDTINERILLNNYEIQLIDSAGLRETNQDVELQGIALTTNAIHAAHLILWVTAANEKISELEKQVFQESIKKKRVLGVINKIDTENGALKERFLSEKGIRHCSISLIEEKNINSLIKMITEEIGVIVSSIELPNILLNKRHEELGRKIVLEMKRAEQEWNRPEIAAHHLKKAQGLIEEIFGKTDNEEILNRIFENFCIGK